MKVVGYARTSWEEQEAGSYPSVEAQEAQLRDFASRAGVTLEKVHSDTGLGPKHGTCAGLVSILDDMEADWEAVVVTSACRLSENPTLSLDAAAELGESGKRVVVASDEAAAALARQHRPGRRRRAEPSGRDDKRRQIAQRLLKGREAGARAGKHQSGPAPFGYRRDYSQRNSQGVLLIPDEEEADVVRLIFREYLRLRSMKRLIKLLDEKGLRTRRGKRWSRAGVSWILKNDTYVGRVHFGRIRAKGRHESIVPPIVFNKVQKLIRENNKRKGSRGTTRKAAPAGKAKAAPTAEAAAETPKAAEAAPVAAAPRPAERAEALTTTARRRRRERLVAAGSRGE